MTQLILVDTASVWQDLRPLTFTKPVSELRCGIWTNTERWAHLLPQTVISYWTQAYLQPKFGKPNLSDASSFWLVASHVIATPQLAERLSNLPQGQHLTDDRGQFVAACMASGQVLDYLERGILPSPSPIILSSPLMSIQRPYDLFLLNGKALELDFELITKNRTSAKVSDTNRVLGNRLFVEEGAWVECATLNTTTGPIYIGKQAEVMEGAMVRGGLALCDFAALKMGAKIYGPTTVGPHCKVGGEVGNTIFMGFSNKGHDGYLGNSVIGEWCNLGADTNSSNLKNNYANVKLYNYTSQKQEDSGQQFCGLIMGDHSKVGINTMFNTGTVVGVGCNVFDAGFPPTFVPDFSWGGASGFQEFRLDKMMELAERVMSRRHLELTEIDKNILNEVYRITRP
jgi:UDP-N-acetylglucosamine diphosphorylase/glucosamine-1-phosphate N-acetyltransferase